MEVPKTIEGRYPNIIMLQLESFFDPTLWRNNPVQGDPIPMFHFLERNFPSGYLSVPSVGAGTANTEFECISAMNLDFFGPGEYPYKTILQKTACESMAFDMKNLGYKAHAVHNNEATFYDRHKVFAQLGFDTFTPIEYMYDIELKDNVKASAMLSDGTYRRKAGGGLPVDSQAVFMEKSLHDRESCTSPSSEGSHHGGFMKRVVEAFSRSHSNNRSLHR